MAESKTATPPLILLAFSPNYGENRVLILNKLQTKNKPSGAVNRHQRRIELAAARREKRVPGYDYDLFASTAPLTGYLPAS
jgi:hypothetical protein